MGGGLTSTNAAVTDVAANTGGAPRAARITAAQSLSFSPDGAGGTGGLIQSGSLTTLSLTQVSSAATAVVYNTPGVSNSGISVAASTENAITGALHTTGGSVTVLQGDTLNGTGGNGNVVDFAIGVSGTPLTTPTISIIQKGNNNQTELTRTAGTNTDNIFSYGNSNLVKVTGSATGTNSVDLTFGADNARTSSSNQATVSQTGANNVFAAQVTGSSNVLDIGQSGTVSQTFDTTSGFGGLDGIVGSSNYLYVRQSNSANAAHVGILGNANRVDINQEGTGGLARLSLNGNYNDVNITQTAAGNSALISLTAQYASFHLAQSTAGASYTYVGTIPTGGSVSVTQ